MNLKRIVYNDIIVTKMDNNIEKIKLEDLSSLDSYLIARVIAEYKEAYRVKTATEEYLAKITGKQIFNALSREDYPAVGDWVAITKLSKERAVIHRILPRKTILRKKYSNKQESQIIATNIDVAFIIESVDRDYNLNRFERYFVLVNDGNIKPAIILNKIDLISDTELNLKIDQIKDRFNNVDIISTSTITEQGVNELMRYIVNGKTYCFLGSSGVGKSSLINKLLAKNTIKIGGINHRIERGKHTTTNREIYFLENGGIVIDNPGMREVGMVDSSTGIENVFSEISALSKNCKYVDCTHTREPGCAVLSAVSSEDLDENKYSNYIKLKKEAEYYSMTKLEKRNKDRQFGKFVKKALKHMKKQLLPVIGILINIFFILIILSPFIKAGEISGYVETGKRSAADDYEEADNDADYTYSNYQVKFKQDLSERFSYDLSLFTYRKDYDNSDDMDNKSRIFKQNWFYYIVKQKEKSLQFDVKIRYKKKDYYDSMEKEFSQFAISPSLKLKKEGLYVLNFLTGFNKYDYTTADQNDQRKYSAKLDGYRYFLKKRLMLSGYYGIEHLDHKQTDRDRTKHNLMSGIDYVFEHPYIYKIGTKVKWGKRDTKDDDEHDEDSDYEYWQYNVKTVHKLNDKLKTDLKYEYFKKDYNVIDLDRRGFYIANGYDYEILNDNARRSWLNFDVGRKDTKYNEKTGNDYKKTIANIQLNYNRKRNWKTSFGIESSFYKYDDAGNDKKRYYTKLSGEKLLLNGNLTVNVDIKYRVTVYGQKADDEQEAVRGGMSYEF
ncbi:MAG: ribosome small subunit-dependent GTPase A [bacterium]